MVVETDVRSRRIVTCDGCGTPYPALVEDDELVLVGPDDGACGSCAGTAFSTLSL